MRHGVAHKEIPTDEKCGEPLGEPVRCTKPFGYCAGALTDDNRRL